MKVLLRRLDNGRFYAAPDQWTENQLEAMDFKQVDVAMDQAEQTPVAGMEVLMQFEDLFEIPMRIVPRPMELPPNATPLLP